MPHSGSKPPAPSEGPSSAETPRPTLVFPRGCRLTAEDLYLFRQGTHRRLWERLGAHLSEIDGVRGTSFAVWAPGARRVAVVGDFNGWDPSRHLLQRIEGSGIWWGFVAAVAAGALYKFHIESRFDGYRVSKTDPFALRAEISPKTASRVAAIDYTWGDATWMADRDGRLAARRPMSIYELHLGSWRRDAAAPGRLPSYTEIAEPLIAHLERTGFTHVEFMPLMEHPYYGSWGYQVTGFFAATSRYGEPEALMALIDRLHQAGFGVVLDWVPSHFPGDEHGLARFDGTRLFEHADPRRGWHPDWKSHIFNYGRPEVRSFLISSALYWIERFHADALRVDAVASMLYLDYSRKAGEWVPNKFGGREDLEAIDFLRALNEAVHAAHPDVLTIAEESTAWPLVSRPAYLGGLGFDMKWDMGWMHDALHYSSLDPVHRKFHHNAVTFRQIYAWAENFVLALSHDEVVHGKRSLLAKMPGDDWQRRANLRLLFGLMFAQPGKKLLFMGGEFGQWSEWNHESGLDWPLRDWTAHAGIEQWVADLNRIYRQEPALHERDFEPEGFRWVDCADADNSVFAFTRHGLAEDEIVFVVANCTPIPRPSYRVGAPRPGVWRELANGDAHAYGGSGLGNYGAASTEATAWHSHPQSLSLTLPPLAVVFLKWEPATAPPPVIEPAAELAES